MLFPYSLHCTVDYVNEALKRNEGTVVEKPPGKPIGSKRGLKKGQRWGAHHEEVCKELNKRAMDPLFAMSAGLQSLMCPTVNKDSFKEADVKTRFGEMALKVRECGMGHLMQCSLEIECTNSATHHHSAQGEIMSLEPEFHVNPNLNPNGDTVSGRGFTARSSLATVIKLILQCEMGVVP